MRVECTECPFSKAIDVEDDSELPHEVVVEHGSETGHTLSPDPVEE